jgi:hypothetical protein
MGLGKSLMMLAAIMASLDDAKIYARCETTTASSDDKFTIAAKTTLIIVPSVC